jgi:hypothetical protein
VKPKYFKYNFYQLCFRAGVEAGESERQMVTCNPEEASVYYDATPQVNNNPPENDSSGSHPIPGDAKSSTNEKQNGTAFIPNGDVVGISNHGDVEESPENGAKSTVTAEEPISPIESPNMALSPTHTSMALGGCTPGLRRRREASDKYATSIAELGLRFQRRRRHFAGSSASGSSEKESGGESRECTPLIDTANSFQP